MPIQPNFLEQMIFLNLNLGPGVILDIWSGIGLRVIVAAVRLGVFEALADAPLTPEALAQQISAHPRGMKVLLSTLAAFGYVRERDGAYANTAMTAKWMLRRSAGFDAGFEFWGFNLFQLMNNLEDSLRTGQPPLNLYEWIETQPEASHAFQQWMVAIAKFAGDEIVRKVALPPGAGRLLDIGGGHARYAIAFCRQYPGLQATVFDSPQALQSAEASLAETGLTARVTLQAGNFLSDDLGSGYDVALLFNVVHGFSDEQNQALVNRATRALNPGGLLVVVEQLAGRASTPAANATKEILGVSYFHLLGGQLWDYEDVRRWLVTAGCANVRRIDSPRLPGTSLVLGSRS